MVASLGDCQHLGPCSKPQTDIYICTWFFIFSVTRLTRQGRTFFLLISKHQHICWCKTAKNVGLSAVINILVVYDHCFIFCKRQMISIPNWTANNFFSQEFRVRPITYIPRRATLFIHRWKVNRGPCHLKEWNQKEEHKRPQTSFYTFFIILIFHHMDIKHDTCNTIIIMPHILFCLVRRMYKRLLHLGNLNCTWVIHAE